MQESMPGYLLIAELLGFGTGTVLSVLLVLLIRRTAYRSPGTPLLAFCALLWNVFGLIANLLVFAGFSMRALSVVLVQAVELTGGAMFPISFLQLWSHPAAGGWHTRVGRWLVAAATFNAAWIAALLFACPFLRSPLVMRFSHHAVAWNASFLMTLGAFLLLRGRLGATSDRVYLALTLVGAWGSTISILLLENARVSPELESVLAIAREQSPFLAVLGAMFFFANFRSSDLLIKHSLRVVAAVSIGVWTWFFLSGTLPGLALRLGAFPEVSRAALAGGLIASLLLVFYVLARLIGDLVDAWILRQPDFRSTLRRLWERMARIDAGAELFTSAESIVCEALDISAARVLRPGEIPGIEAHAMANAGRSWELCCNDPGRRILPGLDVDLLVPIRVHGEVTHVMAVAPGRFHRNLLNSEIEFLETAAGQIGSRLEALAHEIEKMERQSREATLRELAAQAELKALRAQINPHFLFNSLNTIADLIVTDPDKAEAMTVLLAKVFRHVLMHSDQQFSRVAEEMEFLRTYLGIEQVRFGPRLRVSMDMDPTVSQAPIPSLILQPIVENAIKHGLAPKVGQGHISITAALHGEFVRLAVEDDGVGVKAATPADVPAAPPAGNGLGLRIIADRLRTLYSGRASLDVQLAESLGGRVTILIPRHDSVARSEAVV
ncbi:putative Histidine kinase internal region [Candidatus Sulfopaludibacter sp. SbA4]|nr:putative Histidine kinase internal region [Candidatus Sulfopaludibacter sp. SbA4]